MIYKIDFKLDIVQEMDTFLCRVPSLKTLTEVNPIYKPIDHKIREILPQNENLSHTSMDWMLYMLFYQMYRKMDIVFQIALDKQHLSFKDK